jgi:hypothetical protein
MFKLMTPCATCPFRRDTGGQFALSAGRLKEIFRADAFQCHKTIDYDEFEDPMGRQGEHPQQCAGLMGLLYREGRPNTIMQVASRLGALDMNKLDTKTCFQSFAETIKAHYSAR